MFITRDEQRMYFGSKRPIKEKPSDDFKIWYVDRVNGGWSQASYLESPINGGARALYPTISSKGTMFFQAIRENGFGGRDVYYSQLIDGKYATPVLLDESINSAHGEGDVLVAPDENYLIVNCDGRSDSLGSGDLYLSFRGEDGSWMDLKNMGPKINSAEQDYCPMLSPDGKYFFFTSLRTGNGDVYWVDAKIIEAMK
jgi:hypothetical protein